MMDVSEVEWDWANMTNSTIAKNLVEANAAQKAFARYIEWFTKGLEEKLKL